MKIFSKHFLNVFTAVVIYSIAYSASAQNQTKQYDEGISNLATKPFIRKEYIDVYHNYVLLVDEKVRDKIMKNLYEKGIETKIHYPIPLHLQECSKNLNYKDGDIPKCESYAKSMISLPIYPTLTNDEINYIIKNVNEELNL